MIIYLDTSSLAKLYIDEPHSDFVRRWAEEAEILATCRVAFPEMISAANRRLRHGDISKNDYKRMKARFLKDWDRFSVIDFDEHTAAALVEKYGLRGFDGVHLASAWLLKENRNDLSLAFSSFDDKLNEAALREGFTVLFP